uniref:Uncharacterized protein n=1 Tax=Opuntia streptacantha TaxID=393608 RepID=A0A7C9ACH7_OPUST
MTQSPEHGTRVRVPSIPPLSQDINPATSSSFPTPTRTKFPLERENNQSRQRKQSIGRDCYRPFDEREKSDDPTGAVGCGGGPDPLPFPLPYLPRTHGRPGHCLHWPNLRPSQHRGLAFHRQFHVPGHPGSTQRLLSHPQPHPSPPHPRLVCIQPLLRRRPHPHPKTTGRTGGG